jgi:hypothetical protein
MKPLLLRYACRVNPGVASFTLIYWRRHGKKTVDRSRSRSRGNAAHAARLENRRRCDGGFQEATQACSGLRVGGAEPARRHGGGSCSGGDAAQSHAEIAALALRARASPPWNRGKPRFSSVTSFPLPDRRSRCALGPRRLGTEENPGFPP